MILFRLSTLWIVAPLNVGVPPQERRPSQEQSEDDRPRETHTQQLGKDQHRGCDRRRLRREAMGAHPGQIAPQAAADEAGHRVRVARQRHPALRRPRRDAASGRRADGAEGRRTAAQVAGPPAPPLRGLRPAAGHPLRHLDSPGRVRSDPGLRPARAGAGLLRGGGAREPRHGSARPRAVDLRPARQPAHPPRGIAPASSPTESSRRCTSTTSTRASSSTTRKGARCAPRRSSTTRTTSMSAAG